MKTKLSHLVIVFGMITMTVSAQVTDASFDPALAAQLQDALDNAVITGGVKGSSVAITIPGQGRFIGIAGESHAGVPITSDMQFCVGSNTKLFTAVVILKLQEDGFLSLDDPVSDYMPPMPHVNPAITIRQLLNHQSGIFDFEQELFPNENFYMAMDPFVYGPEIFYNPEDVMAMIGPPHFEPGEKYSYSNTNYLLAAMIAEAASGSTFVELTHQYILDPFDLDKTFLGAWEAPNGTVANGWHLGDDIGNVPTVAPHSMYLGSGNVFSTADDMEKWRHHLFEGDIINASSLADLLNFEPASHYTYGLERSHVLTAPDDDAWTHTGWVPGYTSVCGYDVKWGSITILNNDENSFTPLFPLLDIVYGLLKENDAGISAIVQPVSNTCNSSVAPQVILNNFGSDELTSATIHYSLDGGTGSTYNWSGNLAAGTSVAVQLPVISYGTGEHLFEASTSDPNEVDDGQPLNDGFKSHFINNDGVTAAGSLYEDFEDAQFPPEGWLNGELKSHTWDRSRLSLLDGTGCAVKANWWDFTLREYDLELPLLDLTQLNKPELSFNYAYGYAGLSYDDGLSILISSDCGQTYQTVFHKNGQGLKTALAPGPFYPDDNQWDHETVNLSNFKNYQVLIKFRATSSWGNMLYIDQISVDEKSGNQRIATTGNIEFDVYPNPANEALNIRFADAASGHLELVNAIGQVVYSQPVNSDWIRIDTCDCKPGIYFLKYSDGNTNLVEVVSINR